MSLFDEVKTEELTKKQRSNRVQESLDYIRHLLKKIPEFSLLIGKAEYSPEQFGASSSKTIGEELFANVKKEDLVEFDRSVLSLISYRQIIQGDYELLVKNQKGDNKLTLKTFNEFRDFLINNLGDNLRLVEYYVAINDIGKSDNAVLALEKLGIECKDHDEVLAKLAENNLLPTLNNLKLHEKETLNNVLTNSINMAQFIQGSCVPRTCESLGKLSKQEVDIMTAECALDIAGVLGHLGNKNGSSSFNETTVRNILDARNSIISNQPSDMLNSYLNTKAIQLGLQPNTELSLATAKISMMLRTSDKNVAKTVCNRLSDENFKDLVRELNVSGFDSEIAILPYYVSSLFSNSLSFFKKSGSQNPLEDTLEVCLPFLKDKFSETRNMLKESDGPIYIMGLREYSILASQDPKKLLEEIK